MTMISDVLNQLQENIVLQIQTMESVLNYTRKGRFLSNNCIETVTLFKTEVQENDCLALR